MICKVCHHCGLCEGDGSVVQNKNMLVEQSLTFGAGGDVAAPGDASFSPSDIGIAFDIGTTTIAATAYTLRDAKQIFSCGEENYQIQFGSDVIARISFASTPEGYDALHKIVLIQLNHIIQRILASVEPQFLAARIGRASLKKIVIAGNTAMESFAAGVSVAGLATFPFTVGNAFGYSVKGSNLFNEKSAVPPDAEIYFAPVISAFVGGDCACAMTACGFTKALLQQDNVYDEKKNSDCNHSENALVLADVGTNCEMAVYDPSSKKIFCTSSAAGPAFEGQGISCGMTATEGAIADVRANCSDETSGAAADDSTLSSNRKPIVTIKTIGGGEPIGLCGTGLLSACASFLQANIIDKTGAIVSGESQVTLGESTIAVTQKDVRNFQLAKAAVQSGLEVLLERTAAKKVTLFLAGGFGTALNPEDAKAVGMIPHSFSGDVVGVGNASLAGASLVLLSNGYREQTKKMTTLAQSIDLAQDAAFHTRYIEALNF